MDKKTLTIQQVAETTNLSEHTLRYYERIGLIHPISRASSGHRCYSVDDVGWIEFLMKLRATGMSIQQMQAYAELQREGDATLPQRVEMLKVHERQVTAEMQELAKNLDVIRYKITYYSGVIAESESEAVGK